MQGKLEVLPRLDKAAPAEAILHALNNTSIAKMLQRESEDLRASHVHTAATNFQIRKLWERLQRLGLGDEINSPSQIPQGMELAEMYTR
eukprot:12412531-Karenia_brevis.AAC.1